MEDDLFEAIAALLKKETDEKGKEVMALLLGIGRPVYAAPPPAPAAPEKLKRPRRRRFVDKHGLHAAAKDYLSSCPNYRTSLIALEEAMRDQGKLQEEERTTVLTRTLNKTKGTFRIQGGIVILMRPNKVKEDA